MAESAKDFCSDLLDLSGISLAELHSSDDPALRRALSRAEHRASLAFGTLNESNSEEMRFLRERGQGQRRP
ncbi:hypothetical protein LXH13_18385 [Streptomyces spinosirectus]|jgi:hypothetical protein|uniref:hypothetical protein n=1 Tax=Streptomyces TaxID=1883 RepID=UPI000D4D99EA|nr:MULTISPECIES: hypothetical protein [Streptomyces]MBY8340142.1 hypothetical protein [Streptomyces plumbidurans]PTM88890.1 hypothetical protein C7821_11348 [Streptomyces sp. VMFN-G11Ma]UIR18897.1 hypothetical protein LXH13_18385 [Streptomyces spinosirectus]